ncbi:hypothetical protein NHX12_011495 [Muraenolepis orangiensis]|uniref:Uncharacterized protein n=1 Tax=Muraenolepis orangiensis TaxID=630683 RepID=A0A9Q0DJ07_9TELE|nr:hypothetical protein NHX12_011495 [Muraenolepis orangiensis]
MGFDHVMTPVVKIINSIRSKAKQHRSFKVLLEELSAEYGDQQISLLQDTEWILDFAFLTDVTGKLNNLNRERQGKDSVVQEDSSQRCHLWRTMAGEAERFPQKRGFASCRRAAGRQGWYLG